MQRMKKTLCLLLGIVLILGMMPMTALASENTETVHEHFYETVVTAPTCTEQGYTTYTCNCGDSYVADYVETLGHSYENGICADCAAIQSSKIWNVVSDGKSVGAYSSLQDAVDACPTGGTVTLTADCAAIDGVTVEKDITINGDDHSVDISGCTDAFIVVAKGLEVTIRNLVLDGGANGFEVDYDAVTYTNYTIPLVSDSLNNDPKASQSAIISSGTLVCENVDISNRLYRFCRRCHADPGR